MANYEQFMWIFPDIVADGHLAEKIEKTPGMQWVRGKLTEGIKYLFLSLFWLDRNLRRSKQD